MNVRTSPHPTDQTLNAYGLGKLEEMLAEVVGRHLEECAECQNRVSEMSADSFLDRVREAQDDSRTSAKGESRIDGGASRPGVNAVTPAAETLPPGLADHPDYAIKKELGRGGMGVVYLAHNSMMGRDEVLKVMGRQIMERPGVLDRFSREIRAVAKLRHPNIVTAYTAFRLNDSIVFAMEFVNGLDLAKMVKAKGALPVSHACNFIYQAALGLQHAHEEGMVHRDIKPGNLMLARKGDKATIKVLDFGLAKVTREEKVDGGLTSVGQALGTPDFIAPEQILDAQSADIRADIYSLGGTLYYLLTGRPPFKANSLYDIYQAHISRDADPLNLIRPEVPFELAALVSKMMAKEPSRRFQTPGEVAEALKPFFRKGANAFQGVRADVSQGDLEADRPVAASVSRPAPAASVPPDQSKKLFDATTLSAGRWESLIDLREDESSVQPVVRTQPERGRPSRRWAIGLAASLLGLVALGVIVITISNEHGETRMVVPEGKQAKVEQGGVTVEVRPAEPNAEPGGGLPRPSEAQLPRATPEADRGILKKEPNDDLTRRSGEIVASKTADALQEGTHWTGVLRQLDRDDRTAVYCSKFVVRKRVGTQVEATYSEIRGDGVVNIKGQVSDGHLSWKMAEPVSGHFKKEDRISLDGELGGSRFDAWLEWTLPNGLQRKYKCVFFKEADSGAIEREASEVRSPTQPANLEDSVRKGTIWYGTASFETKGIYSKNFPLVLQIDRRDGDKFDGIYICDSGRIVLEMSGTVTGGRMIEWKVFGDVDFSGTTLKGTVEGDRIDFDHYWKRNGQPMHGTGTFVLNAGTGVNPRKL